MLLITLDRPDRLNALSVGMKRDLIELLTQVQADDETRAVVLTGAGRAFCAGDYVHPDYVAEEPTAVPAIEWWAPRRGVDVRRAEDALPGARPRPAGRRQADDRRDQRTGGAERAVARARLRPALRHRPRRGSAAARCASA